MLLCNRRVSHFGVDFVIAGKTVADDNYLARAVRIDVAGQPSIVLWYRFGAIAVSDTIVQWTLTAPCGVIASDEATAT